MHSVQLFCRGTHFAKKHQPPHQMPIVHIAQNKMWSAYLTMNGENFLLNKKHKDKPFQLEEDTSARSSS
jgi:hypothetical protein